MKYNKPMRQTISRNVNKAFLRRWRQLPGSRVSLTGSGNEKEVNPIVSLAPAPLPDPVIVAEATRGTRVVPRAAAAVAAVAAVAATTEEGEYRMPTQLMSALIFRTTIPDAATAPIRALLQAAARLEDPGEEVTRITSGARPEAVAGLAGRV
jgi:hypothetical protein